MFHIVWVATTMIMVFYVNEQQEIQFLEQFTDLKYDILKSSSMLLCELCL